MKGDILSGILAVVIILGSTILVLNTVNPFVEESKGFQSFNEARQTLETIDAVINQLLVEGPGSRRSLDVSVRDGRMIVSSQESKIKIRLDDINALSGFSSSGNIQVTGGTPMKAYESDIDGVPSLVLENSAIVFAVKKLGSSTNMVSVNTTNFITLMRNKALNLNVTPKSGIFINDKDASSYGTGYTALTQQGENLASGGIFVFVNSTGGNVSYEATFTLGSGNDFLETQVKNVVGG